MYGLQPNAVIITEENLQLSAEITEFCLYVGLVVYLEVNSAI